LPDFEIPDTHISLRSLVQFIQIAFRRVPTRINGEITVAAEHSEVRKYMARFRVMSAGAIHRVDSTSLEMPPSDDTLLGLARGVLKVTNPCAVAAYDYDKTPSAALDTAELCITQARGQEKALGYHVWARVLRDDKKPDQALEKINAAIKLKPKAAVLYVTRSAIWSDLQQSERAIQDVRRAIKYDPNRPMAYNNLGYLLWKTGKAAEGECNLRHAIDLNPQNMLARVNLGIVLASPQGGAASTPCEYGKDIQYTSLSDALLRSGHWKEAIVISGKALAAKEPGADAARRNALAAELNASDHKVKP
jgi:predicted Zn-dependent protease